MLVSAIAFSGAGFLGMIPGSMHPVVKRKPRITDGMTRLATRNTVPSSPCKGSTTNATNSAEGNTISSVVPKMLHQ